MKKTFFFCLCVSIFFSCKKDKVTAIPEFHIVGTANNNSIVFTYSVLAYADTIAGEYRLRIFGNVGSSIGTNNITLTIVSSSPIGTGTFSASGTQSSILGTSIDYTVNEIPCKYIKANFPLLTITALLPLLQ